MTSRTLRRILSVYQTGAGLGGIWLVLITGQLELHSVSVTRVILETALIAFCVLLVVSGFLLGRGDKLGVSLSTYAQLIQVPQILTRSFSFALFTPASLTLAGRGNGDVGLDFNLAAQFMLGLGRPIEIWTIGVNILPLVVLYLLRSRLRDLVIQERIAADAA